VSIFTKVSLSTMKGIMPRTEMCSLPGGRRSQIHDPRTLRAQTFTKEAWYNTHKLGFIVFMCRGKQGRISWLSLPCVQMKICAGPSQIVGCCLILLQGSVFSVQKCKCRKGGSEIPNLILKSNCAAAHHLGTTTGQSQRHTANQFTA
jgi:hypothetical protein